MVTKEGKEYLEVNLHSPRILTSTRTQGRFGNGHGVEYTEEYFVEYWRPGFNKWVRWRNRRGMEVRTRYLLAARLLDRFESVRTLFFSLSFSLFLRFLPASNSRPFDSVSFIVVKERDVRENARNPFEIYRVDYAFGCTRNDVSSCNLAGMLILNVLIRKSLFVGRRLYWKRF